ncbi:hypothetical protein HanRHA438_Chr15g0699571 [Helianthus annuus]|nr:hypothetical protein HanRHA438_Chr15g0699571 [Helianthus annuus]
MAYTTIITILPMVTTTNYNDQKEEVRDNGPFLQQPDPIQLQGTSPAGAALRYLNDGAPPPSTACFSLKKIVSKSK